jgi:hypothetical protein
VAILAAEGLWSVVVRGAPRRWRWAVVVLGVTALVPSNVVVLTAMAASAGRAGPWTHMSVDEAAALDWLAQQPVDEVVLASPDLGLFIPAWAGQRVVYGHPFETLQAEVRRQEVEAYFQAGQTEVAERYGVRYVVVGPRERALGAEAPPLGDCAFAHGAVCVMDLGRGVVGN